MRFSEGANYSLLGHSQKGEGWMSVPFPSARICRVRLFQTELTAAALRSGPSTALRPRIECAGYSFANFSAIPFMQ